MREMIPHIKWTRENRPQEKETMTPQILSPERVRDSRHLNGDKAADVETKTPYVTKQTSPTMSQKARHLRKHKNGLPKMSPIPWRTPKSPRQHPPDRISVRGCEK